MKKLAGGHRTTSDPLQSYLNEISQIPLLTIEEEKELGQQAQRGEEGAIQKLVSSNLRFVVSVAKRYRTFGVPFLDLINEGNLGLIEAARRFDPERNIRFLSYAVWWIRQSMMDLLSRMGHTLRLPIKVNTALYKINCASARLTSNSNRKPTKEEIAENTGINVNEVSELMSFNGSHWSLDQPIGQDFQTLKDILPQGNPIDAEEKMMRQAMHKGLKDVLSESLKDKERKVLAFRYGLADGKCYTLKQIGEKLGVSRERVRQIQEKALAKLRLNRKTRTLLADCFTGAA